MKTFSNFSTPHLKHTYDAYECYKQVCFSRLTELDKKGCLETDLQILSNKIAEVNILMSAVEEELTTRTDYEQNHTIIIEGKS